MGRGGHLHEPADLHRFFFQSSRAIIMTNRAGALAAGLTAIVALALFGVVVRNQANSELQFAELRRLLEQAPPAANNPRCDWAAATSAVGAAITVDEMRRLLTEALGALEKDRKRLTEVAAPKSEDSHESIAALAQANGIVKGAIAKGVWGQAEADAMGELHVQLTPDQLMEVSRQLNPAINSQKLRVEVRGPLF